MPITIDPSAIYPLDTLPRLLGISPEQIAKSKKSGELKSYRRGGKWFVRGTDLAAYMSPTSSEVTP